MQIHSPPFEDRTAGSCRSHASALSMGPFLVWWTSRLFPPLFYWINSLVHILVIPNICDVDSSCLKNVSDVVSRSFTQGNTRFHVHICWNKFISLSSSKFNCEYWEIHFMHIIKGYRFWKFHIFHIYMQ